MTEPVTLIPNYIPAEIASEMFDALCLGLAWERRDTAPRSEYWTNTYDRPYTYGTGAGQRTYEAQPSHAIIDMLGDRIASDTGHFLEGCFLNMYLNGLDALGWHADDDKGIDHSKPIAVVTLGQGRALRYKSQVKGSHPTEVFLGNGSLLLMHAGMQFTHFHMIPQVRDPIGARISLTYRGLVPASDFSARLEG